MDFIANFRRLFFAEAQATVKKKIFLTSDKTFLSLSFCTTHFSDVFNGLADAEQIACTALILDPSCAIQVLIYQVKSTRHGVAWWRPAPPRTNLEGSSAKPAPRPLCLTCVCVCVCPLRFRGVVKSLTYPALLFTMLVAPQPGSRVAMEPEAVSSYVCFTRAKEAVGTVCGQDQPESGDCRPQGEVVHGR